MKGNKKSPAISRILIAIDGSNFYNRLKEPPLSFKNLLEFDFANFIAFLLGNNSLIDATYYIGAIRTEKNNPKSFELFRNQIKLFGSLTRQGLKISRGYILKNDGYHEKGVDVQIATDILIGAYENLYDKVVILSSDTDLLPAIIKAKSLGKTIEYVGFSHKPSFAMIRHSNLRRLLNKDDLLPFCKK